MLRHLGMLTEIWIRLLLLLLLGLLLCLKFPYRFELSLLATSSLVLFHAWEDLSFTLASWFLLPRSGGFARSRIGVCVGRYAEIHSRNTWDCSVDEFGKNPKNSLSKREGYRSTILVRFMLQEISRKENGPVREPWVGKDVRLWRETTIRKPDGSRKDNLNYCSKEGQIRRTKGLEMMKSSKREAANERWKKPLETVQNA
jgi:hypothetical protein